MSAATDQRQPPPRRGRSRQPGPGLNASLEQPVYLAALVSQCAVLPWLTESSHLVVPISGTTFKRVCEGALVEALEKVAQ